MKKIILAIMVCLSLVLSINTTNVKAGESSYESFTSTANEEDFTYTIDAALGTATITGYTGTATDIVVPAKITYRDIEYTVTEIANNTFYDNDVIRSVCIEDGIKKIGTQAFARCSSLEKIELPDSVETIARESFRKCTELKEINLPGSMKEIPQSCFYDCTSLTEIMIPAGVEVINPQAFYNCSSLSTVSFENDSILKTIKGDAFSYCNLSKIEIPEGVQEIADDFLCSNPIRKLILPKSVTSVTGYYNRLYGFDNDHKSIVIKSDIPLSISGENAEIYGLSGSKVQTAAREDGHSFFPINPPSGLRAEKLGISSVKLEWSSVGMAARYKVLRASQPDGEYKEIAIVADTEYVDTEASRESVWYYKVCVTYTDCLGETLDGMESNIVCSEILLKSISMNKSYEELKLGETLELSVTYNPSDTTEDKTVFWTSSDEDVAEVDENGNVTAKSEGEATITATVGNKEANCVICVKKPVPKSYIDVPEESWFESYVSYATELGVMSGYGDGRFGPNDNLARSQFAVVLYRMEGSPAVSFKNKFPDVKDNMWYSDAITWASEKGIITGYTDSGLFGVADNITREQLATMLYRYANYMGEDTSKRGRGRDYPDFDRISSFAYDAIHWSFGEGIISGDNGKINPQGSVNRAVCATMIVRLCTNVLQENLEAGDFYLGAQGMHLDFPESWKGKVEIRYYTSNCVEIYSKVVSDLESDSLYGYYDGTLITIVAKSKYELDWTNSIFLGENDGLYYYCYYPTDLRYDWSDTYQREEYQMLSESAESVMETFRLI